MPPFFEGLKLVDILGAVALVVAVITLYLAFLTLKSAKDTVEPLQATADRLRESANLQAQIVRDLRTSRVVEQLAREAGTLNAVITCLAFIPRIPSRMTVEADNDEAYTAALERFYKEERTRLTIALATIPNLELPLTREAASSTHFAEIMGKITPAQTEATTKLNEIVTKLLAASSSDEGQGTPG